MYIYPKTLSLPVAPENRPGPKVKGGLPTPHFSGAFAVSFREGYNQRDEAVFDMFCIGEDAMF